MKYSFDWACLFLSASTWFFNLLQLYLQNEQSQLALDQIRQAGNDSFKDDEASRVHVTMPGTKTWKNKAFRFIN